MKNPLDTTAQQTIEGFMTQPEAMTSGDPLATPITVDGKMYWAARSHRGILKRVNKAPLFQRATTTNWLKSKGLQARISAQL